MYGDEETCLHEAGHAVAARLLHRKVSLVTVASGEALAGCVWWRGRLVTAKMPPSWSPMITWPGSWQRAIQGDIAVALAGDLAEQLFLPRLPGRAPLTLADEAADRLAVAGDEMPALATEDEVRRAARGVSEGAESDAEMVARLIRVACLDDVWRAAPLLGWLQAETAELLRAGEEHVRRVAALLAERGTLGESAARAALRGVG